MSARWSVCGIRRRLLGRHVGRRAERQAGAGDRRLPRLVERLGDAEVGDQRVAVRDQHVVGLDVPVNDAVPVGIAQRVGHVAQDPHGLGHGQLAVSRRAVRGATRPRPAAWSSRAGRPPRRRRAAGRCGDAGATRRGGSRGGTGPGSGWPRAPGGSTLITTCRPSSVSSATNTRLMAPPPSSRLEDVAVGQRRPEAVEHVGQGSLA